VPTYQYVCTECGGQIEAVQRFTDDPLTVHDACGGRLRKVFSPVGIVFKGSGFYRTDSRNGSSASAPASSSSASSSSSSDSSASSTSSSSSASSSGGEKTGSASSSSASSSGSPGKKVA
jgi:putative FmdB family regulatory protein